MPSLEELDGHDIAELGARVAMGLWGENTGLLWTQRCAAIIQRKPAGIAWRLHYDASGACTSMSWPAWDGRGGW